MTETKITLKESEIPTKWYNIQADMPEPIDPYLNPETKEPVTPEELAPIFPNAIIEQEVSRKRWITVPDEVRDALKIWRPSPLVRATNLEDALDTPAKIYYKWEGVSPPGSHKPNTSVAQAYYNKKEGVKRLSTETGAGQWGSALSFATSLFDLDLTVYMVKVSYEQKPYRRVMMETWGGEVTPSPSEKTEAGRSILEKDPDTTGSLGIAISEAVEDAAKRDDTKYALGSVLNHVVLHQTVIGLEAKKQLEKVGEYPDVVYGNVGGGSNFGGIAFPFVKDNLEGENVRIVGCESTACPTMTKGLYRYDFGDTAMMTPLMPMYTLGHDFVPPAIHAGGLRYHGDSPLVSKLYHDGHLHAEAHPQNAVFEAAELFARTEGHIVAPESAHAIKGAIDEAKRCRQKNEEKTILIGNSGHGHFDLSAYDEYHQGKLVDYEYPEELVKESLENLPEV